MPENVTTTPDKLELEILRACGLAFPREHDAQAKAVTDALRLALNQALLIDEYLSSADPEQATLRSRWAVFDGSGCQEDGPACHAFLGEQCGSHDCGRFSQQDILSAQRRKELNTRWWLANELRKLAGPGTYTSPLQRILMAVSLQALGESNEQLRRLQGENVLDAVFPLRLLAHEASELGQRCIEWVGKIRSPESKLEKRDLLLELAPLLKEVAVELGYPQQASADDESPSEVESFPEKLDLKPIVEADADEEEFSWPEWLDPSEMAGQGADSNSRSEDKPPQFKLEERAGEYVLVCEETAAEALIGSRESEVAVAQAISLHGPFTGPGRAESLAEAAKPFHEGWKAKASAGQGPKSAANRLRKRLARGPILLRTDCYGFELNPHQTRKLDP